MATSEKPKKRMPFSPVRSKRIKDEKEKHMTERQIAARRRQMQENRERQMEGLVVKGESSGERMTRTSDRGTRITGLIVDELTRAYTVILRLDGPADVLMKAFFKSNPKLGARDRSILAEAIYYGLRHLAGISFRMAPVKPERAPRVAALITLALQYGPESMPDSVYGREKGPVDNMLAVKMNKAPNDVKAEMPFWLYERIQSQYGDECWDIFKASCGQAPLDLRVNTLKAKREDVLNELTTHRVKGEAMQYSPDGIRLRDKPGLIRWPMYQEGRIDVQDEGSQLIARLVAPRRGDMVCDFCAGAGGKTLALGALMKSTGRLYAFDINEKRLASMTPRMRRAGLSNVHAVAIRDEKDARIKRLRGKFDRVLVDAPCTGTGTLRRNPDLKWRLSVAELERINAVQKSVLEEASRLLKNGGRLVYATCSMLKQENQDVVEEFLANHPDFVVYDATQILAKQGAELPANQRELCGDYFAMLPNRHDTDGFFAAVLVKKA